MTGRYGIGAAVLTAAIVAFPGCGGSSAPTSPTPTPAPAPARVAAVTVAYSPSPAPYAGATGVAACASFPNVWKFTTTFTESGGVAVTLSSVVATLDGVAQPAQTINTSVPASGSLTNNSEICFPTSTQHTLQHAFSGTDSQGRAVSLTGPQLVLSAK